VTQRHRRWPCRPELNCALCALLGLPAAVSLVTGLDGKLTRGSSLVLLSPDEATLDSAACYLNTISRVLVLLGDDGPTITAFCHEPAKSKAISAFQAFHRSGVPLEAGPLLLEFLVSNGATISDANTLNDYARHVTDNTEIPTHAGHRFRDDILQVWRQAATPATGDRRASDRVSRRRDKETPEPS